MRQLIVLILSLIPLLANAQISIENADSLLKKNKVCVVVTSGTGCLDMEDRLDQKGNCIYQKRPHDAEAIYYEYDDQNRIISSAWGLPNVPPTAYQYYYEYDACGYEIRFISPHYNYDSQVERYDTTYCVNSYDAQGRWIEQTSFKTGMDTIVEYRCKYDAITGNLLFEQDRYEKHMYTYYSNGSLEKEELYRDNELAQTSTYKYDHLGRLTSIERIDHTRSNWLWNSKKIERLTYNDKGQLIKHYANYNESCFGDRYIEVMYEYLPNGLLHAAYTDTTAPIVEFYAWYQYEYH